MKITLTEIGPSGEDGEHFRYELDLDLATPEEAYVKGREYMRLLMALRDGFNDEWEENKNVRLISTADDPEEEEE
jgi:hypothetical protein